MTKLIVSCPCVIHSQNYILFYFMLYRGGNILKHTIFIPFIFILRLTLHNYSINVTPISLFYITPILP